MQQQVHLLDIGSTLDATRGTTPPKPQVIHYVIKIAVQNKNKQTTRLSNNQPFSLARSIVLSHETQQEHEP